jgi:hypothetical protein
MIVLHATEVAYIPHESLALVCSTPAKVSPEASVQDHQGPPLAPCGSQESPLHSQPGGFIESPLYPLDRVVRQTSLCHILRQALPIWARYCTILMGGRSTNRSLDLGMMTNHRILESIEQSPKLSESTEHSSKPVTANPYSLH